MPTMWCSRSRCCWTSGPARRSATCSSSAASRIRVTKVDAYTVRVTLAEPYAAAERLFDSIAILPRHLLERRVRAGRAGRCLVARRRRRRRSPGSGPYRLKQYVAGQELVLERNPYYWKVDSAKRRLPYIDELVFVFAGNEDAQVIRFQSGDSDVLGRTSADNFAVLVARPGGEALSAQGSRARASNTTSWSSTRTI